MRTPTRIALAALAALLCARAGAAQDAAWVRVAPAGEGFSARMPGRPAPRPERAQAGELRVSGRRYAAAGKGGSLYLIWALNDPANVGALLSAGGYVSERHGGEALYLDRVAELAWGLIIAPEIERLKRNPPGGELVYPEMNYGREFDVGGSPAREYRARLEKAGGPVYVCADGPRIYIAAALGPDPQAPELSRFVNSFALRAQTPASSARAPRARPGRRQPSGVKTPALPVPATIDVDPMLLRAETGGQAGDAATSAGAPGDDGRPFKVSEVTKKAMPTSKPEPGFTEDARKFNVVGVVRLRAVLAATGEVKNISVVKGLPHGLTSRALAAARALRFTPAEVNGRPVSQWVTFEYNFNIY